MPQNVKKDILLATPMVGNGTNNGSNKRKAVLLEHPQRFWVDYIIEASSEAQARTVAKELCLEQTVELPGHIESVRQVEAYTVGTIERVQGPLPVPPGNKMICLYRVSIAFPNDTTGGELPQFLNVVFGNTSLKKGIAVDNVLLSPNLENNHQMFPGPRFGIDGLRKLLGIPRAPLLCTALKPMGSSSQELASMAYDLAKGGIDIIKDDHGLSNQVWAPFEERVKLCSEAVKKANQETGKRCIYAPCCNAPTQKIIEQAYYAKKCGAGAIMLLPGISGWDVVRYLAASPKFNLPILIHPALLGGWLQHTESKNDGGEEHPHGFSHQFLFGVLPRLCGGDAIIFPNAGGRFQFSFEECQNIADGCRRPLGRFEPVLPSPAGGMKLERVPEMRKIFGDDTLFLIGGALLEQGPDLEKDALAFQHSAGRDRPYSRLQSILSTMTNDDKITTVGKEFTTTVQEEHKPSNMKVEDLSNHAGYELNTKVSIAQVEHVAMAVRRRVLEYTIKNNGGYLSQACSSAEALSTLYLRALNLGPSIAQPIPGPFCGSPGPGIDTVTGEGYNGDFNDPGLDRLIFSPVHYAVVLYSLLVELGRLDLAAFESYNKDGSTVELIGAEHSPGMACTAGSLSQALSQAAGIAYARKLKGHTGRVVVYMSDGEFQEGQTWEAVEAMVFHKIDNLTAVVDVNGQQCDGKMEEVFNMGSILEKLAAFGAAVTEVDGHNVVDIERAVNSHDSQSNRPKFVLCRTDPCRGFPLLKERAPKLHFIRFKNGEEIEKWTKILGDMNVPHNGVHILGNGYHKGVVSEAKGSDERSIKSKKQVQMVKPTTTKLEIAGSNAATVLERVSRPHRKNLVEWAKRHPKAIILTADLTSSCEADLLRDTLESSRQYLSLGMAEQNLMSFAGGLAREGYKPFIHSFGVFLTRRPFDQVAMSIAVPNLPVRILGFLPGLTTPGGVTHQAIDDVALMRSIPNMSILEVGDATEVESVLDVTETIDGPVYIRMLRGDVPRLFPKSSPMQLGVVRVLSEGSDLALITTGICTEEAIKARNMIKSSSLSILHFHLSTIVPFPSDAVVKAANAVRYGVITMENHSIVGGVGSAVAEVMAEHAVAKRLIRLGIHGYAHGASREYLLKEYGIDASALIKAMEKLANQKLIDSSMGQKNDDREAESVNEAEINLKERPEDL